MSLRMMFWNVNGRWKQITDTFPVSLHGYDFMFLSETKMAVGSLPNLKNFQIFSDPNVKTRHRGGVAVYAHERISKYVIKVTYDECFISFMLSNSPEYVFIGVYLPPQDSVYADTSAFA